MKKLTLFLVATLFSALSFAALNPYAYGLKSELSDDEETVTITYKLNALATAVNVVIMDGETVVKTQASTGITQGEHRVDISTDGFPKGKTLTWKVVVNGNSVASPTLHDKSYAFYMPSSIAVDVDPESDKFGRWYAIEATRKSTNQTHTGYHTYEPNKNVRALYAFEATLDPIANASGTYGFTGGWNWGATETNVNGDYLNLWRVTTSGGRVFIGKYRAGQTAVVEVNPADLSANFTDVIPAGKRVVSITATGRGEDLKLVILDTDLNITEYDLGVASLVTSATLSRTYTQKVGSNKLTVRNDATITYDNVGGGIWLNQNREGTDLPTIAHITPEGVDYDNLSAGVSHVYCRNSGIAMSPDGSELAVVGAGAKKLTIYSVSKDAAGKISLTQKYDPISTAGSNHTALSYDYAGNLYVANRSDEKINFYAMPYSGTISTPCPSTQAFSLKADPQLNPFAYNLWSELSTDEKTLTIKYSLNAKATSVNWVLMDGNNEVKTVDLASLGLEKGNYTTTISTTDFPTFKQLTWKIEVKGVAVSEPTEYPINYDLYHPSSVDIDNNPENPTFGLILCNEAMQSVKGQKQGDTGEDYLSSSLGAGIYAFNAAFENTGKYNGGIEFTNGRADNASATAYAPRRIRISDDGRIFVTSLNTDGNYLWEVNSENMNEWTSVFQGTLNENKELVDAEGNFVAAPNNGFDVKGAGENLQLAMYSVNLPGITGAAMSGFRLHEYNLGTATTWATAPSKAIVEGKYAINYTGTQVEYDNEGGLWIASYRGTADDTNPGLVHINADGVEDSKLLWNNVRQAGIRFNKDFTKLVVAGYNGAAKKATVYTISKDANGAPVLTQEVVVNMATVGNNLNDFAWDYAGNLYACGNSSEKLAVWAMPHSSDDVVATPAASKYAFSIGKYTVTALTNDENKGTVTGGGEYGAGAVVTLTATPKEGYELLYWSDRSKENPRTITVDGNEALSAYFIKKNDVEPTFSITKVWENTNVTAINTNGYQAVGWDGKVYLQASADSKIMVYNGIGAATEYANSGTGYQIAVDEAGNMIVYNGYFATANPNNILIYSKGSTTGKEVTFTLQNPGRCDFFSASGNIYSEEGGYVYFYCQNTTVVNRLKIKNGAATAADVTTDVVGGNLVAGSSQNHVIKDIFGNLVAHSRLNGIRALNVVTNEVTNFYTLPNLKTNTLGGCSFELSGKEFWAYNMGTTAYTSEWNLYNVTDGQYISAETLCAKDKTTTNKNQAANWLNVQVVDEKTAYIYQYCPTVAVAVWKVTRDHIVSATAENGTVEGAGTYKDNATATLTATANDGYVFKNWTKNGAVVSTENPYSFTVTEDVELVANFDGPFCELILNTNDEAKGIVEGAGFYNVGQTVTIKATPQAGYKLLYWSDRSTQNPRTITMNKKEALSAYFVKVYDEEPTFAIEKVWENTNVPGSADGYQAVGWDGKIYMQNKTAGKIKVYSNGTDAATDYATSNTAGQQIAVDEAGNLIVFNATFYTITPNAIMIYPKGSTTSKTISFTLPHPERCDFISASGDIYSAEGGFVYFYCQNKYAVNRVKIANGELASIDAIGNTAHPATSTSHVMVDIFGNLAAHCRSTAVYSINSYTGETTAFNTSLSGIKLSTLGGCSFELGGKELWAYNVGTTHYNSEWNLYNMTDGEFLSDETLYAKDKVSKKNTGPANWLNVQVVDEETAYIYQFCPEVAVAVWKVSCTITEKTVTIDENANNTTALAPFVGETVTANVVRNFTNGNYMTLTLPFDMSDVQVNQAFGSGNATIYTFASTQKDAEGTLELHFNTTTSIQAGHPYILKLKNAVNGFEVDGVTISTAPTDNEQDGITMQPVLDAGGTLNGTTQYWLASDNYLYHAQTYPTPVLGLRAIFDIPAGSRVRARAVFNSNETTDVVDLTPDQTTTPTVKKVLHKGQLIIIRGEEKYTIQGQRME